MKKTIVLFITLGLLLGCSSNDDSSGELDNLSGTYIAAKVNGTTFISDNSGTFNLISAQLYESGSIFGLGIAAVIYSGDFSAKTLGIGLGGYDFDMVVDGFEAAGEGENFFVSGHYYEANTNGSEISSETESNAYIKITSIDKVNKTISGEFNFIAIDDDNPDVTYTVTDGVFNDVEYVIEE